MKEKMLITMPDGSVWSIDVEIIAMNRAWHYRDEFGGDEALSYKEDTVPLFTEDTYEIEDWASNNMNWSQVAPFAKLVTPAQVDFQKGWINGKKSFV